MSKTSLDKSKIKFLLLEGVHQNAVDTLKAAGYTNIEYLKGALSDDELKEKIADAHFIGIRSRTQLTAEVFDCAKRLVAVGCFCIGTNQVDLDAARERGIAVFNAPYSNTRSVAELVLAQAILLLRGIPEKNASCHRGGWIKSAANSFEIRGKKLGIVGYGSIGTQLSVLAEAMGMQVFFYDTVTKLPLGNATQIAKLHDLLGMCDIVSLHVPELPSTQWMIGEKEIRAMKKGGILINGKGEDFTLDDFLEQMQAVKKMGSLGKILGMLPGMGEMKAQLDQVDDKDLDRVAAIIQSMTSEERQKPQIINDPCHAAAPASSAGTVQPRRCGRTTAQASAHSSVMPQALKNQASSASARLSMPTGIRRLAARYTPQASGSPARPKPQCATTSTTAGSTSSLVALSAMAPRRLPRRP